MIASTPPTRYFLAEKAYFCLVEDYIVFLDLERDDYLFLEPSQKRNFFSILDENPPLHNAAQENGQARHEPNELTVSLLQQGLITPHISQGKSPQPITVNTPHKDLLGYYKVDAKPKIKISHLHNYFAAAFKAAAMLRWWSLKRIVDHIECRKTKYRCSNPQPKNLDFTDAKQLNRLWDLVEIFRILRPLLLSNTNKCLYNALALIEFLSRYEIFPDWVFGVRLGPFSAHCWVQQGEFLLNDSADCTTSFTPILNV
ncbi:MAG: lasso peptide biosynthesis B2 protein [Exilibacterium sp.]